MCPFCGKPFKRLKSHLPHCKMSPGSKSAQINNKPIPTTTFKKTSNKAKTSKVNTDTKLNYPTYQENVKFPVKSKSKKVEKVSVEKECLRNPTFTPTSTASDIPSPEGTNTDTLKPKTKWLAKREQERLKQANLQTQPRIDFTLVSQQEKHKSEMYKNPVKDTHLLKKELTSGQKNLPRINLTSELTTNRINHCTSHPLQRVQRTTGCQLKERMPKCKANPNVSEQMDDSPKPLTKEYTLVAGVKEEGVSVFQTKTCVWDHIKHGLYERRHDGVPVLFPIVSAHKLSYTECVNTSEAALKPQTEKDQNVTMKNSPVQFPFFQTSVQRPVEDALSSRSQNMSVMAYSPEMATGNGGTFFFSSHSEMASNENLVMKCQSASKPSPQSQGRVYSLGKVHFTTIMIYTKTVTSEKKRKEIM